MPRGGVRTGQRVGRSKADPTNALEVCGFKVYRIDAYNICAEKGTTQKFYPTLLSCLLSLLHNEIKVDSNVQNIIKSIELAERRIVDACSGGLRV